jgi:hypothetical protein
LALLFQLRYLLSKIDELLVLYGELFGEAVVCGRFSFVKGDRVSILCL